MIATYSLAEVAPELCGDEMKEPERWLRRQIKAGRIPARKIGRSYRMTAADITAALEVFRTRPAPVEDATVHPIGLTAASLRRRSA